MLQSIRRKIRIWLKSQKVAAHYRRWPYSYWDELKYDDFSHDHVCFAAQQPNVDMAEICPYAKQKNNSSEYSDECDFCKYYGMILYERNPETGEKQLRFVGDGRFLTSFEKQISKEKE